MGVRPREWEAQRTENPCLECERVGGQWIGGVEVSSPATQ